MADTRKIIGLIDKFMEASIWGLVFVLPFSKSMVEIFFAFALAFWISKKVLSRDFIKTGLDLPIYAFMLVSLLSTLCSASLLLSVKGFLSKTLEWVMIYFIVVEAVNKNEALKKILAVMFFSMVLIAADSIYQYFTGVDFLRHYSVGISHGAIQGPFINKNGFACWLVVMIPLSFSIAYLKDDIWPAASMPKYAKYALWILPAALTICLFLTASRGAQIALILSLVFFGTLLFRNNRLFIPLIAAVMLAFLIPNVVTGRIVSTKISSETTRAAFWREALGIIGDFPVLGCGLNTYTFVGARYKVPGGGGCYPHNSYLQMAAETGVVGLGAFLWLVIAVFKISLKNMKKIKDRFCGAILPALLIGLLGFLIHSFVDVSIYSLQLGNLMWMVMGLIIATQRIASCR